MDMIGQSAPNWSHEQTVECGQVNGKGTGTDNRWSLEILVGMAQGFAEREQFGKHL